MDPDAPDLSLLPQMPLRHASYRRVNYKRLPAPERAERADEARIVGIRASGRWTGSEIHADGDERYWIVQCDSPLAMRLALQEQRPDVTTKVLVTGLDDQDLEMDVRLRLAKRQLFPIDSWRIVQTLFQARSIDPRVTRHVWMADMLLQSIPPDGYPPAASGFLDAEAVWGLLLARELNLRPERPDLSALLTWSVERENAARWQQASAPFREAAMEWIDETSGPAAVVILRAVLASEQPDAAPIGLVLGVVFDESVAGKLDRAAGRMEERYLGGESLDRNVIARWHATATEVVTVQLAARPRQCHGLLERADEILADVQADNFAWLSRTSPLGFDQRMARYGGALLDALKIQPVAVPAGLLELRDAIKNHNEAFQRQHRRRIERVEMSLRLLRWLARVQKQGLDRLSSLAAAAQWYLDEGSFVDWARVVLLTEEPRRELSQAYAHLVNEVNLVREKAARRFAELLCDWTAAGSTGEDVVPVERVLDEVVGPLAAEAPVLFIVADGMSGAVCRELLEDITRGNDWTLVCKAGSHTLRPGLATIPSVTEVSRTSLLSGKLQQGDSNTEQAAFQAHPALKQHCGKLPPVLFHKVNLTDPDRAAGIDEVRDQIAARTRRVVGVVLNAIDDHLLKGDQRDTRWTRDEIKVIPMLLHEARTAGRLVILISDHGHVLEHRTEYRPHEAAERWRADEGNPEEGEVQVRGSRVMLAEGQRLIAPWTEKIRYSRAKRNGYHGGLSPQEMVIPIAVLAPGEAAPCGWMLAPPDAPTWWETFDGEAAELPPEDLRPRKPKRPGMLFDLEPEDQQVEEAPAGEEPPRPAWIDSLLASPILEEQKTLAGRVKPREEQLGELLLVLDAAGGKLTSTALAKRLALPPLRLPGFLAMMQRVLNIEGYAVLTRDEASDTVALNRELLCRQFDLN